MINNTRKSLINQAKGTLKINGVLDTIYDNNSYFIIIIITKCIVSSFFFFFFFLDSFGTTVKNKGGNLGIRTPTSH